MKILLALIGGLSVCVSPAISAITTTSLRNKTLATQSERGRWDAPTSMYALQKGVDSYHLRVNPPNMWVGTTEQAVQEAYDALVGITATPIDVLRMKALDETIDNIFQDTYVNNTPNKQTFSTHSYTKEINDTSTFTISLQEKVYVKVKANFFFGETEIMGEFSSSQTWTQTKSIVERITTPSQNFVVDSYSKGIATYITKSGDYSVSGILRYIWPPETKFYTSWFLGSAGISQRASYSLGDIVRLLNDAGYGDLMRMDSEKYSVISADDVNNPTLVSMNLPINYISRGGKFDVQFSQQPLR